MKSLLAIVALIAFPGLLPACSCDRTTVEQSFDAAELVFRSRVISESDRVGAFDRRVVFQVAKVYKGAPGGAIEIMGLAGGSDCIGFTTGAPKVGQSLIVYANLRN